MKKLLFVFGLLLALSGVLFLVQPSVKNVSASRDVKYCHPENGGKYPFTLSDDNSNGSFVYSGNCVKGQGKDAEDDYKQCISDWCASNNPASDQCSNISGVQATVPTGDYQLNGECFPTTAVCDDPKATNFGGTDGIFNSTTETADDSLCQYTAAGTCPTACGQPASTVPDGKGGTISCDATAACPVTPTPTDVPSNGGGSAAGDGRSDGRSDGLSSCPSCTQAPQGNIQAVLGASTMAGTGTFENIVMNFMLVAGMIVLSLGGLSYAKEIKK